MNARRIGKWINGGLFGEGSEQKSASTRLNSSWFWLAAGLFWYVASLTGGSIAQKTAGDTASLTAGVLTGTILTIAGSLVTIWLSGGGPSTFSPKNKVLAAFFLWVSLILFGFGTARMLQLTITAPLGIGTLVLGTLLTTWLGGSNPSHSYIKARALTAYWLSFLFSLLFPVTLIGCLAITIWFTPTFGHGSALVTILILTLWTVILGPIFGLAFYGTASCFKPRVQTDIAKGR